MKEEINRFGRTRELVGTITSPDMEHKNNDLPAVILLNAGLMHRVGPYRLNVDLARKLAFKGFTSLRFDMSRKGDSEKGDILKTYTQLALFNTTEAMDYLAEEMGVKNFILVGLCSGSDQAHPVAASDQRVSGAVFLDGCGYKTGRYYINYIAKRGLRAVHEPSKIKNFIKKKFDSIKLKNSVGVDMQEDEYKARFFPTKEKAKADILQMIDRGVSLLYVYTSGQSYFNYYSQFEDMFGFKVEKYKSRLQVEFFKEADHTYTFIEDRIKLINTISDWMQSHFIDLHNNSSTLSN
jgi:hypothetical protein